MGKRRGPEMGAELHIGELELYAANGEGRCNGKQSHRRYRIAAGTKNAIEWSKQDNVTNQEMSVATIIQEIQNLSAEDQDRIIKFVSVLDAKRKLSGAELTSIATYMVESTDPVETMIAREAIVRGFYGDNNGA